MQVNEKITRFTDLVAWRMSHELVLETYKLSALFPKSELFVLTTQIRRAVVSVTLNIAEGFSRKTAKEKIQFYSIALGSLSEVESQMIIARDLEYITGQQFDYLTIQLINAQKLIQGLIKTAQDRTL